MSFNLSALRSPTVIASTIVLFSSLSIGIGTGLLSFYLGRESLKGVTSPEENPTQKINPNLGNNGERQNFQLMSEKTVLVKVYDYVQTAREESKLKEQQVKK